MTLAVRAPRLLPVTIVTLAVVLGMKVTSLVRTVIDSGGPAALIGAAWATGPDAPAAPDSKDVKPGDYSQLMKPDHAAARLQGNPAAAAGTGSQPSADAPPPMTDGEKSVLLELRARREELEAREAALMGREAVLTAAEKKITARVDELRGLQQRLESLDVSRRKQEDTAWKGLVKMYEDMKPRDAAAIFNDLGMAVLLEVADRMKENKAAAILAAMTPDKARELTTQLALLRTKAAAAAEGVGSPAAAKPPGSGT